MAVEDANSKKVFFSGVLLLSVSTVLVKIIGLIYKIPMLSYLGSEGMGYFNSAYEIYALFCIIATAGLPVALSVLISGGVAKKDSVYVEQLYRSAFRIFFTIGILGSAIMWFGAEYFCSWIKSDGALKAIRAISPTVFFICISSAVRGYFQGFQRMLPTALSQLLESLGKLVFGLIFASTAMTGGYGTESVAAAAGWGLSLGTALSTLFLLIEKKRFEKGKWRVWSDTNPNNGTNVKRNLNSLLSLALPMTLGAALISVSKLIDMTMILRRLQTIGYSESLANQAYGSYTTLAVSLFSFLPTLLNSVSLPLVPMLSTAISEKNELRQKQLIELSYRLTAFFAIPASLGLTAFSYPILNLVFASESEAVETAAPLLSLLGISVFLSSMITATNSVLHAYRIVNRPIFSMLAGTAIKSIVAYVLIGHPLIGLLGAPISSFFCNATVVILNFALAAKKCYHGISVSKIFWRPFAASVISVGGTFFLYRFFGIRYGTGSVLTVVSLLFMVISYLIVAILCKAITSEDFCMIPHGKKCYDVFCRLKNHIFKENIQKTGK